MGTDQDANQIVPRPVHAVRCTVPGCGYAHDSVADSQAEALAEVGALHDAAHVKALVIEPTRRAELQAVIDVNGLAGRIESLARQLDAASRTIAEQAARLEALEQGE